MSTCDQKCESSFRTRHWEGPVDSAVAAGVRGQPVDGLALTRPSLRDDARPQPDHRRLGQLSGLLRLRRRPPTCPQPLGQPSASPTLYETWFRIERASLQVDHTDTQARRRRIFLFLFFRAQRQLGTERAAPAGEGGRAALSLDSSPPVGSAGRFADGFRPDHRCLDNRLVGGCPHALLSRLILNGHRLFFSNQDGVLKDFGERSLHHNHIDTRSPSSISYLALNERNNCREVKKVIDADQLWHGKKMIWICVWSEMTCRIKHL